MSNTFLPQTDDSFPLLGTTTGSALAKNWKPGYRSVDLSINNINNNNKDKDDQESIKDEPATGSPESEEHHKTTAMQTFVHLLKGYMGAGCLSLPWAVSQLGLLWGSVAIFVMAYWSSANCWTIVKLKRYIERERERVPVDDKASETSSVTANTQVTYAAVGEFFYGSKFETYVAACICIQQLAICTVFISFVGENVLAVAQQSGIHFISTHNVAMSLELPIILGLSLIPNLRSLTPVMTLGTVLLMVTFVAIGFIIRKEWDSRPMDPITLDIASAPLALCAILYSYEGINLILPVESAMLEPQHFQIPFILSMLAVAGILASFAVICVVTFGFVSNGSMTAFLVEAFPDDPEIAWLLMIANAAVSLSVLFTYPLQLFPAIELLAPSFSQFLSQKSSDQDDDDDDLSAFEPLPPLPEDGILPVQDWNEHKYNTSIIEDDDNNEEPEEDAATTKGAESFSAMTSLQSILPEMTMPGDSPLLRLLLVLLTFAIAAVVPNVQALISLAGALAGSSSALLIPPLLELAWIRHLEVKPDDPTADATPAQTTTEQGWSVLLSVCKTSVWSFDKVKCYILLLLGFLFFGIGTYASLADIVRIYMDK